MSVVRARWRKIAPAVRTRWRGPGGGLAALADADPPQPIAAIIGPPGRDADAIGAFDAGTFT